MRNHFVAFKDSSRVTSLFYEPSPEPFHTHRHSHGIH